MSFEDTITPIQQSELLSQHYFENRILETPEEQAARIAAEKAEKDRFRLDDEEVVLFGADQSVSDLHDDASSYATPGRETLSRPEMGAKAPFDRAHILGAGKILTEDMRTRFTLAA